MFNCSSQQLKWKFNQLLAINNQSWNKTKWLKIIGEVESSIFNFDFDFLPNSGNNLQPNINCSQYYSVAKHHLRLRQRFCWAASFLASSEEIPRRKSQPYRRQFVSRRTRRQERRLCPMDISQRKRPRESEWQGIEMAASDLHELPSTDQAPVSHFCHAYRGYFNETNSPTIHGVVEFSFQRRRGKITFGFRRAPAKSSPPNLFCVLSFCLSLSLLHSLHSPRADRSGKRSLRILATTELKFSPRIRIFTPGFRRRVVRGINSFLVLVRSWKVLSSRRF